MRRGDIHLVSFGPTEGREQCGSRPSGACRVACREFNFAAINHVCLSLVPATPARWTTLPTSSQLTMLYPERLFYADRDDD